MRETKCSVTHLTPAMGQLLTANAFAEMPDLHLSFFVGDVLTKVSLLSFCSFFLDFSLTMFLFFFFGKQVDVMRLQSLAKNVTVVNMYGTTETQRSYISLNIFVFFLFFLTKVKTERCLSIK